MNAWGVNIETPDPDDVVFVLNTGDEKSDTRIVRWSELVAMTLHDSLVRSPNDWSQIFGSEVPMSADVAESESEASQHRLEEVKILSPALDPIVQILAVPAMTGLIGSVRDLRATAADDPASAVQELGMLVHTALHLSVLSTLSVLVDLGLIEVNPMLFVEIEDEK